MDIKQKRRVAHALMYKAGALPNKRDILAGYGVESSKDLTDRQMDELIERLKEAVSKRKTTPPDVRQWRSNVMTMLNKCGVYADQNDWQRVNKFLLDKRIAGKLLYEMTVPEMKELHRKLASVARKKELEAKNQLYNGIAMN